MCNNTNNSKTIYIAPWFQVTLFKGAVTSKKNSKKNTKKIDNIIKIFQKKKISSAWRIRPTVFLAGEGLLDTLGRSGLLI